MPFLAHVLDKAGLVPHPGQLVLRARSQECFDRSLRVGRLADFGENANTGHVISYGEVEGVRTNSEVKRHAILGLAARALSSKVRRCHII